MNILLKQKLIVIITIILIMFCSCSDRITPAEGREKEAEAADKKEKDITIALVRTSANKSLFAEGALLALEEINGELDIKKKDEEKNEEGGVLIERKFKYKIYDDEGKPDIGAAIARKISKNLDVIAVIGHRFSSVAIPVSIIYEQQGIVFISTGSTTPLLTTHNNHYVFRNVPSDKQIGKTLAIFAKKNNFKKISIFFQRGDYGERLSSFFREEAGKLDISIIATRSYFEKQKKFRQLLEGAQDDQLDAIFLAGSLPEAAYLIKQARSMGLSMPFIAGDALENPDLWLQAGIDAVDTYVAGAFDIESSSGDDFVKKFDKRYRCKKEEKEKDRNCKKYPHADEKGANGEPVKYTYTKAALGYDAVRLLAWAIENSRSTVPLDIASTLKYMKKWEGVLGSYSFASNGDVKDKEIHIKVLSYNGQFKKVQTSISPKEMEEK
jgi:ABC-type branched-subunit amino acid transport system substrate-binding protein